MSHLEEIEIEHRRTPKSDLKRIEKYRKALQENFTNVPDGITDDAMRELIRKGSTRNVGLTCAASGLGILTVAVLASIESVNAWYGLCGIALGMFPYFEYRMLWTKPNRGDLLSIVNQWNLQFDYWVQYRKDREAKALSMKTPSLAIESSKGISVGSWKQSLSSFHSIDEQWAEWEMDILRVVQYPSLFNLGVDSTRSFHEALNYARQVYPAEGEPFERDHPFLKAVSTLETAWKYASSEALRLKTVGFDDDERKRLDRALGLLRIAMDVAGTPAERQVSYKRALKELDGLIHVPDSAMNSIEAMVFAGEIEA